VQHRKGCQRFAYVRGAPRSGAMRLGAPSCVVRTEVFKPAVINNYCKRKVLKRVIFWSALVQMIHAAS
jgi:hypothetical protein